MFPVAVTGSSAPPREVSLQDDSDDDDDDDDVSEGKLARLLRHNTVK